MSTSKTTRHRWAFQTVLTAWNTVPPWNVIPASGITTNGVATANDTVSYGGNYADWRRRIVLGQDATTSLTGTTQRTVRFNSGQCEYWRNGHLRYLWQGNLGQLYFGWNLPSNSINATADQRARQKFLSHYINAKNTWRGANFVAEAHETYQMVRHPVEALFGATISFAKSVLSRKRRQIVRDYKDIVKIRKIVADAWLTWAFGIKPLIADCDDAAKAFNQFKERVGGTGVAMQRVKGHGRETTVSQTLGSGINFVVGDPGTGMSALTVNKTDFDVRYVAGLRARLEDLSTLTTHAGFDPYDALPAVWEAIPWSFFVDYFSNVQEKLDSLRLWSADFSYCYRSVRNAGTRNMLRPHPTAMATATDQRYCYGGGFYTLATWVNRVSLSSIPAPNFEMRIPGMDSTKWLNIAALSEVIRKIKQPK
jgi:hypothetical protein